MEGSKAVRARIDLSLRSPPGLSEDYAPLTHGGELLRHLGSEETSREAYSLSLEFALGSAQPCGCIGRHPTSSLLWQVSKSEADVVV